MPKRQGDSRYEGKINMPGGFVQLKGWRKPYVLMEPTTDRNPERAMPYGMGDDDPKEKHGRPV